MGTYLTNPRLARELAQRKAERIAERNRPEPVKEVAKPEPVVKYEPKPEPKPKVISIFRPGYELWDKLYWACPEYYWFIYAWTLLKNDIKFVKAPHIAWFDIEQFRRDVGFPPGPGYKRVKRPGLMRWGKHTTMWKKIWHSKTVEEEHKFYIGFIREEYLTSILGGRYMQNYKLFIKEDYLLGRHVIQDVHPYGLGIVIHQRELSKAILDKKISPAILTDRNIRVVE